MTRYDEFEQDLPAFVRGTLEPQRARDLLEAAEHDARLREAVEQERALEQWLELYEVPEPSDGLSARFWRRFHNEKAFGEEGSGRAVWLLKLAGPLAAAVLIAAGLILFLGREDGTGSKDNVAITNPGTPDDDVSDEEFINQFVEGEQESTQAQTDGDSIPLEELRLMKQLADPAFSELDLVPHPDDVPLIEDHELLKELAAEEVK